MGFGIVGESISIEIGNHGVLLIDNAKPQSIAKDFVGTILMPVPSFEEPMLSYKSLIANVNFLKVYMGNIHTYCGMTCGLGAAIP